MVASLEVEVVASVMASPVRVSLPPLVVFGTPGARDQKLRRRLLGPHVRRRSVSDYPDRRALRRPWISDGTSPRLIFPDLRRGDSDERVLGMHGGSLRGSLLRRVRGFCSDPAYGWVVAEGAHNRPLTERHQWSFPVILDEKS